MFVNQNVKSLKYMGFGHSNHKNGQGTHIACNVAGFILECKKLACGIRETFS